jgi:hypothetical protein
MRTALAIAGLLLLLSGCTTLREAGQVAVALMHPPTEAQVDAQTKQFGLKMDAANAKVAAMQAAGHQPTDAEMKALVSDMISGKQIEAPVASDGPPPPDQEISVNLTFAGMSSPSIKNKNLGFKFKALWGTYKVTSQDISMPARTGKGEARLDLGEAHLRVIPKIVSSTRGRYDIELTDNSGALIGRFNIAESGKQVDITQQPSKYDASLVYFHPERRLTGYSITKPGSRKPVLGVIFVGKGWSYVENAKKPDMSKGYLFPEVDMVVLPKGWMEEHDYEMKDTCNTLKRGEIVYGATCYT